MDSELCHQILTFVHEHIQYEIRQGFSLKKIARNKKIHHIIHFILIHAHMRAHRFTIPLNLNTLKLY